MPSDKAPATLRRIVVSSEIPAPRSASAESDTDSVGPEDPYDERGRARPIYGTRSPRPPVAWRPSRLTRLMMGLVPGVEALVAGRLRQGAPYVVLGLAALVSALLLVASYASTLESLRSLRIQPRFIVWHAAAIFALVTAYELLRCGASLEARPNYATRTPRMLASLWLPAVLLAVAGPVVVRHAPRFVEAAWMTSLVVAVGASPAVAWCALSDLLSDPERQRFFRTASAAALGFLVVLAGVCALTFGSDFATAAREAGFRILPGLLG